MLGTVIAMSEILLNAQRFSSAVLPSEGFEVLMADSDEYSPLVCNAM
jgi:hypothetical protein